MTTSHQPSSGTIAALRDLVPLRPLTHSEAMRVAERQATKLLALSGVTMPPVPEQVISDLPRIDVRRDSPFPSSGASQWTHGAWRIIVNGSEPPVRQRFTLAHEFKHVLDHPFIGFLYPGLTGQRAYDRAEQLCDYFASCLLMPKAWVTSAYFNHNIQRIDLLALRFRVSQMAMRVRLLQLGIIQAQPRCTPYYRAKTACLDSLALPDTGIVLEEVA